MAVTVPIVVLYIFVVNIAQVFGPMTADNYLILFTLRIAEQIALFFFPITIMFSILRYRLWDIDLAINHTLVSVMITGVLLVPFGVVFWHTRLIVDAVLWGWSRKLTRLRWRGWLWGCCSNRRALKLAILLTGIFTGCGLKSIS